MTTAETPKKVVPKKIGVTLSGEEFNKEYKDKRFVKLTTEDEKHNEYQYVTGLNELKGEFKNEGICKDGGLYFTEYKDFPYWIEPRINYRYSNLRDVTIPDDAQVYIVKDKQGFTKFKTNKFILGEKTDFSTNKELSTHIVAYHFSYIKYIRNPSQEICELAVKKDYRAIYYIKNPSIELCKIAIEQNTKALDYIIEPSNELIMFHLVCCNIAKNQQLQKLLAEQKLPEQLALLKQIEQFKDKQEVEQLQNKLKVFGEEQQKMLAEQQEKLTQELQTFKN